MTKREAEKVYTVEQIEELFKDIDDILIKWGNEATYMRDEILKLQDRFDLHKKIEF